ncbi:MAG TPA: hypothetical protein VMJ11_24105 [Paraburkholderia sp.]|uniref:hypothetical protein n=1 Tax=Paraburkholderia sp. TaxID=1926495 RepID=UPI002B677D8B|nr:hypothetical protein [Paraburkholderia sp.]HTR09682.1 hypothetical protein [Paraburkholderia sp.]
MAHVDRRAVLLQCAINDFDSADNPRTKAAGLGKDHSHKVANSNYRICERIGKNDLIAAAVYLLRMQKIRQKMTE